MVATSLQRFLLDPASYPERPETVTSTETHVSRLYFTPERVYKIKKPVDFGFLDFTTLTRRHYFCQEEVRLNRRFAPDTYERIVAIRRHQGRFNFDGPGRAVEYAVVMKRLPEDRLLINLLEREEQKLEKEVDRLGRHLATLHRQAPICLNGNEEPATVVMQHNWRENFTQMLPLVGSTLHPQALSICRDWITAFFDHHQSALQQRETDGWVREGHGDLHTEHICMTDPIQIYDCIEFNRRFRVGDILSDLAFLLMDLDFRGHPELARRLLRSWQTAMGSPTADDDRLLPFYRLYRAFVRGKVNTFLACEEDAQPEVRSEATALARRYFNLALGYLLPPTLLITCGLMGVGKSALARQLSRALRALQLRSDEIRKELAGLAANHAVTDDFATGLYSNGWNERTYQELFNQTLAALSAGRSVIVDAAFGRRSDRERFAALARQLSRPFLILHLTCGEELTLQRLKQRQLSGNDASDGRPELYARQALAFEPPLAAEEALVIDGGDQLDYNVQQVLLQLLTRHGAIEA